MIIGSQLSFVEGHNWSTSRCLTSTIVLHQHRVDNNDILCSALILYRTQSSLTQVSKSQITKTLGLPGKWFIGYPSRRLPECVCTSLVANKIKDLLDLEFHTYVYFTSFLSKMLTNILTSDKKLLQHPITEKTLQALITSRRKPNQRIQLYRTGVADWVTWHSCTSAIGQLNPRGRRGGNPPGNHTRPTDESLLKFASQVTPGGALRPVRVLLRIQLPPGPAQQGAPTLSLPANSSTLRWKLKGGEIDSEG